MRILQSLEEKLEPFAIRHLTMHLIIGQIILFGMNLLRPGSIHYFSLIPNAILEGEAWRLFSFLFVPPGAHPLFLAFIWYLLWFMGNVLEEHCGSFRYNLFWLTGAIVTIAAAFITPGYTATNSFLMGSVFLVFAFLNPNFEIMLFFVLPVKIKWLALLTWLTYGYIIFFTATLNETFLILAVVFNFLLFFGKDLLQNIKSMLR